MTILNQEQDRFINFGNAEIIDIKGRHYKHVSGKEYDEWRFYLIQPDGTEIILGTYYDADEKTVVRHRLIEAFNNDISFVMMPQAKKMPDLEGDTK